MSADIKKWQDRMSDFVPHLGMGASIAAKDAEIADWRARHAVVSEGQAVAEVELKSYGEHDWQVYWSGEISKEINGLYFRNYKVGDKVKLYIRHAAPAPEAPADPLDWPLPCDITVGAGTIRKGCPLRTLVARMQVLSDATRGALILARAEAAQEAPPSCPICPDGKLIGHWTHWCDKCGVTVATSDDCKANVQHMKAAGGQHDDGFDVAPALDTLKSNVDARYGVANACPLCGSPVENHSWNCAFDPKVLDEDLAQEAPHDRQAMGHAEMLAILDPWPCSNAAQEAPPYHDGPRLDIEKCIAQFRMYAEGHSDKMAKHQLNFCADFLRDHGPVTALPVASSDGCKFCLGAKGGVPGNGNVVGGEVLCDYCTSLLMKIVDASPRLSSGLPLTAPSEVQASPTMWQYRVADVKARFPSLTYEQAVHNALLSEVVDLRAYIAARPAVVSEVHTIQTGTERDDRMWDTNSVMGFMLRLPGAIERTRGPNVEDVLNALMLMEKQFANEKKGGEA
jgi:hypothetical protein